MSAAPNRPYAIRIAEHGGPEVIRVEPADPGEPGPRELLVRHEAVGLNFIDTYFRTGLYPAELPHGLGSEAAGVVEAAGSAAGEFAVGDRVGYFTGPPGAYATHRLVEQSRLVRLPDSIGFETAAASLLKGCTAEYLIERCARVRPDEWVLVHAAAGGVGSILVQWLKAIGARVISHAGSEEKAAAARALGADHSLHCAMDELGDAVRDLTGGEGVRVSLDGVGAASWQASLRALGRRGLLVSYGNASGPVPPFSALDLSRAGSLFVTRPTLGDYAATPGEMRASAERLFEMMESGAVEVRIGARFPLHRAAEAHRALEGRRTAGSTVLLP